jgi:glycosyltransferase involved in cell wall biosynthesis
MAIYNRAPNYLHLAAESIESFLRQKLPSGVDAELVIFNDTPGQKLELDKTATDRLGPQGPGQGREKTIRLVQWNRRCDSLGAKRNILIHYAQGDVLLPWDDDDISLPSRIEQALDFLGSGHAYFNPQRTWFLGGDVDNCALYSEHQHGYCHNASAFTREAFARVHGYPPTNNEDKHMDIRLREAVGVNEPVLDPRQWQFVYRFGVSPCHLSGENDGPLSDPCELQYERIGKEPIVKGTFTIRPAWRRDYVAWCQRYAFGILPEIASL